jgi:hypothetical protein
MLSAVLLDVVNARLTNPLPVKRGVTSRLYQVPAVIGPLAATGAE